MESLSSVAVPLHRLTCQQCQSESGGSEEQVFLKYEATAVDIDGGQDSDPVSVTLDVKKISWRQMSPGRYHATALFSLSCPGCGREHEFHHQLEAPIVFLKQLGKCRSCGGRLEIYDETVEYLDPPDKEPFIEVTAKLHCKDCESTQNQQNVVPSPDLASLRSACEIDIDLSDARVTPHTTKKTKKSENKCRFDVALSFPGVYRVFVQEVATRLCDMLGKDRVFYDKHFEAELARPGLDAYLQGIYRKDARLVVVFLCEAYGESEWCGLEWRAVRDIIKSRSESGVMLMRFDEVELPGLFSIDGYVNLSNRTPETAALLIKRRLDFDA